MAESRYALVFALLAVVGFCFQRSEAARFINLGDLGGQVGSSSTARDISADGSVVVGSVGPLGAQQAFRWTEQTGMAGLGQLPGNSDSGAAAVSADGNLVVGGAGSNSFIWTKGAGLASLPSLPNYRVNIAQDVSSDGNVIVGHAYANAFSSIRWIKNGNSFGQWQPIGVSASNVNGSISHATSADGSVSVGQLILQPNYGVYEAFHTSPSGTARLGDVPGGRFNSTAMDVSADGSVVVGVGEANGRSYAFRWSKSEGIMPLDEVTPETYYSEAAAVSADGSVIVGLSYPLGAFRWTRERGTESIFQLLANQGVNVAGWNGTRALGVSADGRFIVGDGDDPSGNYRGWWADLAVPEPTTHLLAVSAIAQLFVRRRRRRGAGR